MIIQYSRRPYVSLYNTVLVGGLEQFLFFSIYWDSGTNIFQRDWNHQPVGIFSPILSKNIKRGPARAPPCPNSARQIFPKQSTTLCLVEWYFYHYDLAKMGCSRGGVWDLWYLGFSVMWFIDIVWWQMHLQMCCFAIAGVDDQRLLAV